MGAGRGIFKSRCQDNFTRHQVLRADLRAERRLRQEFFRCGQRRRLRLRGKLKLDRQSWHGVTVLNQMQPSARFKANQCDQNGVG